MIQDVETTVEVLKDAGLVGKVPRVSANHTNISRLIVRFMW